jgi:hypothetical protein
MCSYGPTIASEQQSPNKALHSLNKRVPFTFYASKQVSLQWKIPRTGQLGVGVTDDVSLANVAFCEVNPQLGVEDIPVLLTVVTFNDWVVSAVGEVAEVHEDEEVQVAEVEQDVTSEFENEYSNVEDDGAKEAWEDTE